jgi:hypothetical protein
MTPLELVISAITTQPTSSPEELSTIPYSASGRRLAHAGALSQNTSRERNNRQIFLMILPSYSAARRMPPTMAGLSAGASRSAPVASGRMSLCQFQHSSRLPTTQWQPLQAIDTNICTVPIRRLLQISLAGPAISQHHHTHILLLPNLHLNRRLFIMVPFMRHEASVRPASGRKNITKPRRRVTKDEISRPSLLPWEGSQSLLRNTSALENVVKAHKRSQSAPSLTGWRGWGSPFGFILYPDISRFTLSSTSTSENASESALARQMGTQSLHIIFPPANKDKCKPDLRGNLHS